MMTRSSILEVLHAAQAAGRLDFLRSAAAVWLASWPGDHEVQLRLAEAESQMGLTQAAAKRLTWIIAADPELVAAYDILAQVSHLLGDFSRSQVLKACSAALRSEETSRDDSPSWAITLGSAMRSLLQGDAESAVRHARESLQAEVGMPLPTLIASRAHLAASDNAAALALARSGHDRWPECIAFRILIALDTLNHGDKGRGVDWLHRLAADDPLGRVSARYLGANHPYLGLWPKELRAEFERQIPAEVLAVLGRNRLPGASPSPAAEPAGSPDPARLVRRAKEVGAEPAGSPDPARLVRRAKEVGAEPISERPESRSVPPEAKSAPMAPIDRPGEDAPMPVPQPWEAYRGPDPGDHPPDSVPEDDPQTLKEIRLEFDKIGERIGSRRSAREQDGRKPAYVVLSSRTRMLQLAGAEPYERLAEAIRALAQAVRKSSSWPAYEVYVDDPSVLAPFSLRPVDPANAWQVKLLLADLDRALSAKGEMIGALLIVGDDSIVPFHSLPNPTDDDDPAIPSDNPYATTDENYFAPEWAVGRLPGHDIGQLTDLVRHLAEEHRLSSERSSFLHRFWVWLNLRLHRLAKVRPRALGYSAEIWRKSSLAVFRGIGEAGSLITSPPTDISSLPSGALRPASLSYYNLHGIEDASEWFGQRDPSQEKAGPDFPIALRPQDVVNGGQAPVVAFTEACYGANIHGKTSESAICLKLLASGCRAVLGSTKISYGSITPPLIAADLLGRLFWENLHRRLPVGEALRRAKLNLAAEMHRRQGYLDGEDQKTLISFVLYGDPLYTPYPVGRFSGRKAVIRKTVRPRSMKTACALGGPTTSDAQVDPETLGRVKAILASYLPSMSDARCSVHSQRCGCEGADHLCPTHQLGVKAGPHDSSDTVLVTFAKSMPEGVHQHSRFARLTLDRSGRVVKLAVSR